MGKRILLADDSVTIQKVVELTFMDEDYEVVAVSNGDDAVARLDEVQPDLVIADIHMPGASGYDVCSQAKQWRPGIPVLLLVGTFEPFQEEEARRAGADGYLKKPFDSQELLRRVEELIAAAAAAAAEQPGVLMTPADEMDLWQAPEAPTEEQRGDLYAEADGVPVDEPAGPLGQEVPTELVLEASPWTEAEEEELPAAAETIPEAPPATPAEPPPIAAVPSAPQVQPSPPRVEPPIPAATAPPIPAAAPPPAPRPAAPAAAPALNGSLSEADVDRVARRVVELLGDHLVREVVWEVVPDMAELVIKDRIRELERQLEGP